MNKSLVSLLVVAAFAGLNPASAAEIVHYDAGGAAFTTSRGPGSAPFGRLTVGSNITVSQIGSLVDLNGDQQMQFLIFNAATGANLFTSAIQSFVDDGLNYNWSGPLNFTFMPGIIYSVGATTSGSAAYAVDEIFNTVGGFSFHTGNQNSEGKFGFSTLGKDQNCCDVATGFRTADMSGAVPEPSTWLMLVLGFFFVGSALRRKRLPVSSKAVA